MKYADNFPSCMYIDELGDSDPLTPQDADEERIVGLLKEQSVHKIIADFRAELGSTALESVE